MGSWPSLFPARRYPPFFCTAVRTQRALSLLLQVGSSAEAFLYIAESKFRFIFSFIEMTSLPFFAVSSCYWTKPNPPSRLDHAPTAQARQLCLNWQVTSHTTSFLLIAHLFYCNQCYSFHFAALCWNELSWSLWGSRHQFFSTQECCIYLLNILQQQLSCVRGVRA